MKSASTAHLRLCDACCDASGTAKEMFKTGGCTCDICGWACKCCGDQGRQFVNSIPVRVIPDQGWAALQERNRRSLLPLDWEALFLCGREDSADNK
ncbi:hypothetical protein [Pseudodesulfovibrio tunisiensis]|uniref:hypothetical protein n=1 Tax=Pseudodesulfovibrio tunisiensis TaxID=463192 RepID=UPI001FB3A098|nr:hypothetical protein [Pseudodesulfovibrio tunisiensis]